MILSNNIGNYFVGEFAYPKDKLINLTDFIDKSEKEIITMLLGYELAKQFFADIQNGLPTTDKWQKFTNGDEYESSGELIKFSGILEMLQYFILDLLLNKFENSNTGIGKRSLDADYSQPISKINIEIEGNYMHGNGLKLYNEAYDYIFFLNNQINITADAIADNFNNTYTVYLTDTTNLCNHQAVFISGQKFFITNLITDTSFDFKTTSGKFFNPNFWTLFFGTLYYTEILPKKIIDY
jgi:hypothetical protein